ncbi:MAG: 1-acyl-sn-glycerol-3-phosphate acyltransferase [Treponema sp.]|jgi:1-acyl-sn-glycerol-3-phosphate acyltransferase|nr:1-acyl-sn-glycerol-3-phosphate acyltransferase [Treponema sp.]
MDLRRAVVNRILKGVIDTLCNIDSQEFVKTLSGASPLIVAVNHINFLEVPILVAHSYPLPLTGLVKSETWNNPVMSFLFNTYKAIPINRGGAYQDSFRRVRDAMDQGFFICMAPEGTRSKNGILGRGKAGIIQLALYTGAPVLPVVHFGGERIWSNIRRLRRTPFRFKVGRPFRFKCEGRPDRTTRELMLAELMGQMARLLPEEMRGVHAEQALRESRYLEFV